MAQVVRRDTGFTLVEVVVTLAFVSIMAAGILSILFQVGQLSIISQQRTTASYLAYSNMRKYVSDEPPVWFTCTNGAPGVAQQTLIDQTGRVDGLPGEVRQLVTASAPYGCGGGTNSLGMPIRVESIVEYGGGRKVVHVSYAAF